MSRKLKLSLMMNSSQCQSMPLDISIQWESELLPSVDQQKKLDLQGYDTPSPDILLRQNIFFHRSRKSPNLCPNFTQAQRQISTVATRTHLIVAMGLSWPVATVTMRHSSDRWPRCQRHIKLVATGESMSISTKEHSSDEQ
jgi:hypothetical protein